MSSSKKREKDSESSSVDKKSSGDCEVNGPIENDTTHPEQQKHPKVQSNGLLSANEAFKESKHENMSDTGSTSSVSSHHSITSFEMLNENDYMKLRAEFIHGVNLEDFALAGFGAPDTSRGEMEDGHIYGYGTGTSATSSTTGASTDEVENNYHTRVGSEGSGNIIDASECESENGNVNTPSSQREYEVVPDTDRDSSDGASSVESEQWANSPNQAIWTDLELRCLWMGIATHGNNWKQIQSFCPGRTCSQIKDKSTGLLRPMGWISGTDRAQGMIAQFEARLLGEIGLRQHERKLREDENNKQKTHCTQEN